MALESKEDGDPASIPEEAYRGTEQLLPKRASWRQHELVIGCRSDQTLWERQRVLNSYYLLGTVLAFFFFHSNYII